VLVDVAMVLVTVGESVNVATVADAVTLLVAEGVGQMVAVFNGSAVSVANRVAVLVGNGVDVGSIASVFVT